MIIKICGISLVEDALVAAEAGADFVGVVFAPSRRQVSPAQAAAMAAAVHAANVKCHVVGVFAGQTAEEVNRLAAECRLDLVQLSGGEDAEFCENIKLPIIKAIHVSPAMTAQDVLVRVEFLKHALPGREVIFLLDTAGAYGGTGQRFDWQVAAEVSAHFPIMVAGGLNPANVKELIERAKPWGVDTSSGVETGGRKDIAKIRAFIAAARQAEAVKSGR